MQTTRPTNRREFMTKLIEPYEEANRFSQLKNNPNEIYTEPKQAGMPELNRGYEVTTRHDQQKDFYIGIKDIDEAVMYYFKNVLKLSVIQNNTRLEVPVLYANPENWKSMQADGYYRDSVGKLMAPLIVFKRDSITQNRTLGNKLDGNLVHNIQLFEKGYSKRNFYSNFELLKKSGNRKEEKEYMIAVSPDYITVQYTCTIWAFFIEQMDKLVEALNFASRAYWGDPNRFLFNSSIETFNEEVVYGIGEERAVKVNFNITLNGYLIPDSINKKLAAQSRTFGAAQLIFGIETAFDKNGIQQSINKPQSQNLGSMLASDSRNFVVNNYVINSSTQDPALTAWLGLNNTAVGVATSNTTANVNTTWVYPPPSYTGAPLTQDAFTFFVNGQLIPKSAVLSFNDTGILVIDPSILGFNFVTSPIPDEIVAVGKLQ